MIGWLSYPANLAFAGVAGSSWRCPWSRLRSRDRCGRAMDRWRTVTTGVFTNTFREFGRPGAALGLSLAGALLGRRSATGCSSAAKGVALATVMAAAFLPSPRSLLLVGVHLPAAAAAERDAGPRRWLRRPRRRGDAPLRSVGVLVAVVTWLVLCVTVPTLFPFLGLSVPTFLGLVSAPSCARRR